MNAPNIQLYNLLRYDLHLSDGKSQEFMYALDQEYKYDMKEELKDFGKTMNEGFQTLTECIASLENRMSDGFASVDKRFLDVDKRMSDGFASVDKRFNDVDKRFNAVDNKIDLKTSELRSDLRVEIRDSKVATIIWSVSLFMALALMILAIYLKK